MGRPRQIKWETSPLRVAVGRVKRYAARVLARDASANPGWRFASQFPPPPSRDYNPGMSSGNQNNTMMKTLLIVTALIEAGAGIALVVFPSVAVWLLFGTPLDSPTALTVARVAGAALLSIGIACWLARHGEQSRAAARLITAMLLYNTAVAALLADAGIRSGLFGIALWPGVGLHVVMAAWCIASLRMKRG